MENNQKRRAVKHRAIRSNAGKYDRTELLTADEIDVSVWYTKVLFSGNPAFSILEKITDEFLELEKVCILE